MMTLAPWRADCTFRSWPLDEAMSTALVSCSRWRSAMSRLA